MHQYSLCHPAPLLNLRVTCFSRHSSLITPPFATFPSSYSSQRHFSVFSQSLLQPPSVSPPIVTSFTRYTPPHSPPRSLVSSSVTSHEHSAILFMIILFYLSPLSPSHPLPLSALAFYHTPSLLFYPSHSHPFSCQPMLPSNSRYYLTSCLIFLCPLTLNPPPRRDQGEARGRARVWLIACPTPTPGRPWRTVAGLLTLTSTRHGP